jgi:hypothetical protein
VELFNAKGIRHDPQDQGGEYRYPPLHASLSRSLSLSLSLSRSLALSLFLSLSPTHTHTPHTSGQQLDCLEA